MTIFGCSNTHSAKSSEKYFLNINLQRRDIDSLLFSENFKKVQEMIDSGKVDGKYNHKMERFEITDIFIDGKQVFFSKILYAEFLNRELVLVSIIDNGGFGLNSFSISIIDLQKKEIFFRIISGIVYGLSVFQEANELYLIVHNEIFGRNYDAIQDFTFLHLKDEQILLMEYQELDNFPRTIEWENQYKQAEGKTLE